MCTSLSLKEIMGSFSYYALGKIKTGLKEWQEKKPFETVAQWQGRVTAGARDKKVQEWLAEAERENAYVRSLRDLFIRRVQGEIPYVRLNGHPLLRLPSNAHFSFEYTDGEAVLYSLDLKGIAASAGSACTSGSPEPSHVLAAMGTGDALARGGVRFTFGKDNTEQEVNAAVDALKEIVVRLRARSPRFPKNLKNEVFPRS